MGPVGRFLTSAWLLSLKVELNGLRAVKKLKPTMPAMIALTARGGRFVSAKRSDSFMSIQNVASASKPHKPILTGITVTFQT